MGGNICCLTLKPGPQSRAVYMMHKAGSGWLASNSCVVIA